MKKISEIQDLMLDEKMISNSLTVDNYLIIDSLRHVVLLYILKNYETINIKKFENNFKKVYINHKNDKTLDIHKIIDELIIG